MKLSRAISIVFCLFVIFYSTFSLGTFSSIIFLPGPQLFLSIVTMKKVIYHKRNMKCYGSSKWKRLLSA